MNAARTQYVSDLVREVIGTLRCATSVHVVQDALSEMTDSLGGRYYSFALADRTDRTRRDEMVLANYPEDWRRIYRQRSYEEIDPVMLRGRKAFLPFSWSDGDAQISMTPDDHRRYKEACAYISARDYGITSNGMTVPVHTPSGAVGLFSVVASDESSSSIAVDSATVQGLMAVAPFVCAFLDQSNDAPAVNKDVTVLSDREGECLRWTLQGKTAWEVAQIIGVKKCTVDFHLQKAIRKLDASNKAHAAMIALRQGLI